MNTSGWLENVRLYEEEVGWLFWKQFCWTNDINQTDTEVNLNFLSCSLGCEVSEGTLEASGFGWRTVVFSAPPSLPLAHPVAHGRYWMTFPPHFCCFYSVLWVILGFSFFVFLVLFLSFQLQKQCPERKHSSRPTVCVSILYSFTLSPSPPSSPYTPTNPPTHTQTHQ